MKDRPFVGFVTLVAGLIACICCIVRGVGLFATLVTVLITLFVFMIVGMIANKLLKSVHDEVIQYEKDEQERLIREKEEAEEREFQEHQRKLAEAENAGAAGSPEET